MNRIYLCLAHMSGKEQQFIQEAFDTNWVVPLGPNVNGFEKDLEDFLGKGNVVALSAGTAAIHLGLIMLGVGKGDEVICQSFTFAASANPIVYQGATPVFVDSEADTWNMSPVLLEEAIKDRMQKTGRKPKAIVVAELYGMPARMDEILDIANRYDIPVLEDAAEALGSTYKGRPCGTMGKYGVLSFNGNKMITTSGGGALVCPNEEAKRRVTFYATQAKEPLPYYQHEHVGFNYRLSNICAGIGRGQMTILNEHVAHHRRLHSVYREALADVPGITVHSAPEDYMQPNYWLTTILIDGSKTTAGEAPSDEVMSLMARLDAAGIESRPLWKPLHMQPVFADCPAYVDGTSERLFHSGLCLPSGPCVSDEDMKHIINYLHN